MAEPSWNLAPNAYYSPNSVVTLRGLSVGVKGQCLIKVSRIRVRPIRCYLQYIIFMRLSKSSKCISTAQARKIWLAGAGACRDCALVAHTLTLTLTLALTHSLIHSPSRSHSHSHPRSHSRSHSHPHSHSHSHSHSRSLTTTTTISTFITTITSLDANASRSLDFLLLHLRPLDLTQTLLGVSYRDNLLFVGDAQYCVYASLMSNLNVLSSLLVLEVSCGLWVTFARKYKQQTFHDMPPSPLQGAPLPRLERLKGVLESLQLRCQLAPN